MLKIKKLLTFTQTQLDIIKETEPLYEDTFIKGSIKKIFI